MHCWWGWVRGESEAEMHLRALKLCALVLPNLWGYASTEIPLLNILFSPCYCRNLVGNVKTFISKYNSLEFFSMKVEKYEKCFCFPGLCLKSHPSVKSTS